MAKCNRCGDPKAYVGINHAECPNEKCIAFSLKQLNRVLDEAASKFDASWEINPSASVKTFYKPITVDEWDDEDTKPLYNFGQLDLDLDIKMQEESPILLVSKKVYKEGKPFVVTKMRGSKSELFIDVSIRPVVEITYPVVIKDFIPKK